MICLLLAAHNFTGKQVLHEAPHGRRVADEGHSLTNHMIFHSEQVLPAHQEGSVEKHEGRTQRLPPGTGLHRTAAYVQSRDVTLLPA